MSPKTYHSGNGALPALNFGSEMSFEWEPRAGTGRTVKVIARRPTGLERNRWMGLMLDWQRHATQQADPDQVAELPEELLERAYAVLTQHIKSFDGVAVTEEQLAYLYDEQPSSLLMALYSASRPLETEASESERPSE